MAPHVTEWTEAPRVSHWKQSGATQRVLPFKDPHDGEYAADVGEVLVELYGVEPVDHDVTQKQHETGEWVSDTTINVIMDQFAVLPDVPPSLFRPYSFFMPYWGEASYNRSLCSGYRVNEGLAGRDIVIIVVDLERKHFFTILIETFQRQRAVHVFDTLFNRKAADVKDFLGSMFGTEAGGFAKYNIHTYTPHNMGDPVAAQEGDTCGPWSVWIAVAFIFDIHRCRRRYNATHHGRMLVRPMKMSTQDVVGFWRNLTASNASNASNARGGARKRRKSPKLDKTKPDRTLR